MLEGHRRHGKRFVPPMLEYANLSEVGWHYDLVPVLIWAAVTLRGTDFDRVADALRSTGILSPRRRAG